MSEIKTCTKCKQIKPVSDFAKSKAKKDGLQSQCRSCKKATQSKWYQSHKEEHKSKVACNNKKQREENQRKMINYLLEHPCVDCGETDLRTLEFDHVRKKQQDVGYMLARRYTWNQIKEEISKCVVRCANCHRKKTAQEGNWYTQRYYVGSIPIEGTKRDRLVFEN